MGHSEHKQRSGERRRLLACGVITVSDTRTVETDTSGRLIIDTLTAAGHLVSRYEIVPDEPERIVPLVKEVAANCALIILSGGTGIARRDTTFEAVDALLEKKLPGFGELFRMLSYQEIGAAAMLTRATAGLYGDTIIFSTPGSTAAVRLALEKLIMPELDHMAWLLE
ncbi:MAG: MogA/MoaB family molybdenum cofactor biosynthesis protein [Anaerolineae bacterium]